MKMKPLMLLYKTNESVARVWEINDNAVDIIVETLRGSRIDYVHLFIADTQFPKALLEFQIKKGCEKIGIPYLKQCLIGRWGFKKASN